jgi:hypothetical protein
LTFAKLASSTSPYVGHPFIEYFYHCFGPRIPKVFIHFVTPTNPILVISDLNMIDELYTSKNKYFDKHPKVHNMLKEVGGNNIVLLPSNELYYEKRKHLSVAFYKEKMIQMFEDIIEMT